MSFQEFHNIVLFLQPSVPLVTVKPCSIWCTNFIWCKNLEKWCDWYHSNHRHARSKHFHLDLVYWHFILSVSVCGKGISSSESCFLTHIVSVCHPILWVQQRMFLHNVLLSCFSLWQALQTKAVQRYLWEISHNLIRGDMQP